MFQSATETITTVRAVCKGRAGTIMWVVTRTRVQSPAPTLKADAMACMSNPSTRKVEADRSFLLPLLVLTYSLNLSA